MVRPTSWLPLGALALLVALTVWLDILVQPGEARADGTKRHDPDLIVENFSARKLGEDGRVLYTLVARKMVHYPDDDSSHLESLAFDAFEPQQPRVAITADRGRLEKGTEKVWVEGNVLIKREAADKIEAMVLATDNVLLLPDEGVARTQSEVKLDSASARAVADGFEMNNRDRTLKLNRVRVAYKPAR